MAPANDASLEAVDEELFAITTAGLESVLEAEVRALGHEPYREWGGVRWVAPVGGHQEANLWLRTAHRVWLQLQALPAGSGTHWVRGLRSARLDRYVSKKSAIRLDVEGGGDHSGRLHRETLEMLGRKGGTGDDIPLVELRLSEGDATLWLDTSGEFLFRRGYRQEVSRAPLKESLAAGLLQLAGHEPSAPFLDALCGSGTVAIEAALRVRARAPGMVRSFAFERFSGFQQLLWEKRRLAARAQERPPVPGLIRASDLNAGSLGTARRNSKRAGVFEDLTLTRQDVATLHRPEGTQPGLWLSNLPYGKRLTGDLATLYRAVGETWRREFPDWTFGALVEDGELLEASIGRPPSAQFTVAQGGLHCALWVWRP